MTKIISESKKSLENYIMVDLKSVESNRKSSDVTPTQQTKEASRATENVHSSMYGQNRKHNSINKPVSTKYNNNVKQENVPKSTTKSFSLDHTNVTKSQETIHRTHSAKNITTIHSTNNNIKQKTQRQRPSSLLVTKDDSSKSYLRSKSMDEAKNSVKNCLLTKFNEGMSPASSLEKLTKLKERLLNTATETDNIRTNLDSDDESTPLVSDISTPSVSVGHNSAFSPQSDKFSSPEKNKTDSTEYSPISPITHGNNTTVNVSSVCNVLQGNYGTQTVHESCVGTDLSARVGLSNASSEVSLSYYLEAASKFSNSSLASVGSLPSEGSVARTFSNSSGISRQNALDTEENFKDLDN